MAYFDDDSLSLEEQLALENMERPDAFSDLEDQGLDLDDLGNYWDTDDDEDESFDYDEEEKETEDSYVDEGDDY